MNPRVNNDDVRRRRRRHPRPDVEGFIVDGEDREGTLLEGPVHTVMAMDELIVTQILRQGMEIVELELHRFP